eukprot:4868119-Prymnesium_polylepis.1
MFRWFHRTASLQTTLDARRTAPSWILLQPPAHPIRHPILPTVREYPAFKLYVCKSGGANVKER